MDLICEQKVLDLEWMEKNNKQIGAALFYTNANVDVNNISQSSNLDVFTTLVYGNVPVFDDKTRLLYQAIIHGKKIAQQEIYLL